jgi:hypothetical protein
MVSSGLQDTYKEETNQRYHLRRLSVQLVRKLLVVRDEMRNINVAVVLFDEHVLPDLVSE